MIIIQFLYYIVYRVFKLIPRKESIDYKLASSFCAGLFWLNAITILILAGLFNLIHDAMILKILLVTIFGLFYFFNRWYFIKKENYKTIISLFDTRYQSRDYLIPSLGIIYIIGTFFGFWALGFYLGKI
jgi:hypothetical protein